MNFATSKNLTFKSTTFPHRDIHKQTWTSPDGMTDSQIDHILKDKRRQSSIIDIRSFRGADCNTNHYLVIAKLRERLSVAKGVEQEDIFKPTIGKESLNKMCDDKGKVSG